MRLLLSNSMWIFLLNASATSVGTRAVFVLDKMPPWRRPTNEVKVKEVYECDRITRLEQQVDALTKQFQAFLAAQNQHNQNYNPYDSGYDALGGDNFLVVP